MADITCARHFTFEIFFGFKERAHGVQDKSLL